MVDVRGYKLVINLPVFFNYEAEFLADLVVEHSVFDGVDTVLEAGRDAVVGGYAVAVVLGLEVFYEENVAIAVVCKHGILVATA